MNILKNFDKILSVKINNYQIALIIIFLAGVIVRVKLFVCNPSLFKDEAALAINMLDTENYLDFFKPLRFLQVAPPFFMILSKFFYNLCSINGIDALKSDMLLRIVPFVSGIMLIPAFGFLLKKVFNNNFITSVGMMIIALNPLLITFSTNYKQYSTESLVTVLIILLVLSIDLKKDSFIACTLKFLALGLTTFFSMTALFIIPFAPIYIAYSQLKSFKQPIKHLLIKYAYCILVLSVIIAIYYIVFLHGIIQAHYNGMVTFWSNKFSVEIFKLLFLAISFSLFSRNISKIILFGGPIAFTTLMLYTENYPCVDRLILFINPLIILCFMFAFEFIPSKIYKRYNSFLAASLIVITVLLFAKTPDIENYRYAHEYAREVWENIKYKYNDINIPVVFGESHGTNTYYNKMYKRKSLILDDIVSKENWEKLKDGKYILIVTDLPQQYEPQPKAYYKELKKKRNLQVLEIEFSGPISYYMTFEKISKTH